MYIDKMSIYDCRLLTGWTNVWFIHSSMVNKAYKMHMQLFDKNLENQAFPLQLAILAKRGSRGGHSTAQAKW